MGHKIKRHFIWPHFKRFETNIQGNRLKFHVIRYNYIDLEFFFWGGGGWSCTFQPALGVGQVSFGKPLFKILQPT